MVLIPNISIHSTGGIRCERATALLNQMSTVNENLKPKGVYHCRGGIERYVKTFPNGGFWRGKNYLFDRRMEQTPEVKDKDKIENDVNSKCSLCRIKCTVYRGQYKCNRSLCGVPVIVCQSCATVATENPESLVCELCREGYRAPSEIPDLVGMKRKADEIVSRRNEASNISRYDEEREKLLKKPKSFYEDRLFLRRVPLIANFEKIKTAMGKETVLALHWITDQQTGGFYGSCIALMASSECKKQVLERCEARNGIRIGKKKIKVMEVFKKVNVEEDLFQKDFVQKEFPPIGNFCK